MIPFTREDQSVLPATQGANVKVLGIGGAGCNVVDRMVMEGAEGVELMTINTDSRALMTGVTPDRVQLGAELTRGLGAGGDPELGRAAAVESAEAVRSAVQGRRLVFLCAGLGGGTGSGAAPEVARLAREAGAMVIAFATLPFSFEGRRRVEQATSSLDQLRVECDAVIVFENDRMGEVVLATEGVQKAFEAADRLIGRAIRGVAMLVSRPGLIRVGLDDLLAVLRQSAGHCLFGHGLAEGENRAKDALDRALRSPLLHRGRLLNHAASVLVHVAGGEDLRLFEVQTLMRELGRHVAPDAHIFFGMAVDPGLRKSMAVTLFSSLAPGGELSSDTADTLPDLEPEPSPSPRPSSRRTPASRAPTVRPAPEPEPEPAPVADIFELRSDLGAGRPAAADEGSGDASALLPRDAEEEPAPAWDQELDDTAAPEEEARPAMSPSSDETWYDQPQTESYASPDEPPPGEPLIEEAPPDEAPPSPRIRMAEEQPVPVAPAAHTPELSDLVAPKEGSGQRELQLGARTDGGRFENAEPTLIDGEDIDLPAYLRKRNKRR